MSEQPHKHSSMAWPLTLVTAIIIYLLMPIPVLAVLWKVYGSSGFPKPLEGGF